MGRRKTGTSRREFKEKVDRSKTEMANKESDMKVYASDLEQERQTLESLDFNGAEEDAKQVEDAISRAEDITAERFGSENEQLEGIQQENENLEGDFQERHESAESDVDKLQKSKLESSEAVGAMVKAKEAAVRGKEFLKEQIENTNRAREASEQAQRELEERVRRIRGGQ